MNESIKTLRRRITVQIVVPAFFSSALLIIGYLLTAPAVKTMMISERKEMASEMVKSICNLMEGYNEQVKKGELSLTSAQEFVINAVKHLRYGERQTNYVWIQDFQGSIIYHPYIENNDKGRILNKQTAEAVKSAGKITNLIKIQNEGFVSYNWINLQSKTLLIPKEAYIKGFKPWGWIVGTGFLLTDIEAETQQLTHKVMTILVSMLCAFILLLFFILYRNYKNLQKILIKDIELKQSEARFRGFAKNIKTGLVIFEDNAPAFVNDQFCKIFEIDETEAWGFDILNYLPGWEKERVNILMNTPQVNQKLEFETWIRLHDHTEKYISMRVSSDLNSSVTYKYLVVEDLTKQKRTLTTLDVLSETVKQSPASIVITDLNGAIEYVNPGFEQLTGYTFDEVIGQNPRLLKSNKTSGMIYEDLWRTILGGYTWKGEMLNRDKDGGMFWESTIVFPIKNQQNEIIKFASIKTNITQNKQIEQELLIARDKAEENERFKTAFLNNISHEVRTPLNAVYGYTQLLKDEFAKNDAVFRYLKTIEQNCLILLRLFDDIIDYSSIESRAVTLFKKDVHLKGLLLKIVSKYNTQLTVLELKPIEIVVEGDKNFGTMVLHTDRKRIVQIFDKLISNAIKFTVEGRVTISYKINPEFIVFHICDTGVGIPEKEKEFIFNSFSHGDNMFVSLHKGVGLGLNIVKLLVELLGGKLSFTSEKGKGTTFSFTFPTIDLKNYVIDGNRVVSYNQSVSGKNILIAEDNDENFKYFSTILSSENNIVRAKTGLEAVNVIEKGITQIDIILMDVMMPELDGIAASKMIRKIQPLLPIIAFTAVGSVMSDSESGIFDSVLVKPVSAHVLLQKMLEVYEKKKSIKNCS